MIIANEYQSLLLDIKDYFQASVADSDLYYRHNNEGYFDMSGNIRCIPRGYPKTIYVTDGNLALGKYQRLFLHKHRSGKNNKKLIIALSCEWKLDLVI